MARTLDSGSAGWRRWLIGEAVPAATAVGEDDIGPHREPIRHRTPNPDIARVFKVRHSPPGPRPARRLSAPRQTTQRR